MTESKEVLNTLNEMRETFENAVSTRQKMFSRLLDSRRDIDDECGYPKTTDLKLDEHYRQLYDREGIATRVVDVLPDESWILQPKVFESQDAQENTPFEQAWDSLGKNLKGESWYEDEDDNGSPIWEALHKADRLCGVGSYGIILIGLDDGEELNTPVEGVTEEGLKTGNIERQLIYLKVFDQSHLRVVSRESNTINRRFGQPTMYDVTFDDPSYSGEIGDILSNKLVHFSRVVHIADNTGSNDNFGTPRMQSVLNRLLDLRKLFGGSAEMFWRGAFPGLSFETHPQLGGDVSIDSEALKDMAEQYMNGLQRYLQTSGMSAKSLAPQVADPTAHIEVQINAICIRLGIPKRIFLGSERGELASSQDAKAWNRRMTGRQNNFITPRIIAPFIDKLVQTGVLPEPKKFGVKWPELDNLTASERADISLKRTDSMVKFVQGDLADSLMTSTDYLIEELGLPPEKAEELLQNLIEDLGGEENIGKSDDDEGEFNG